ncbi:50S ribosomal protein L18 [Patescibacteria group bacterium]|nr:50S ribosomal protein L18 [Patescibacteria group bacterium]
MYTKTKQDRKLRRHARIRAKVSGTVEKPRLVVFRSLSHISAQLIDDKTGKTLCSAHDIKAKKGTKTERAKAVGIELAEKAQKAKITTCVFDRNGYLYHGRVKALAEGAREGGLKF